MNRYNPAVNAPADLEPADFLLTNDRGPPPTRGEVPHPLYEIYDDMLKNELPKYSGFEAVDNGTGVRNDENSANSQIMAFLDEHMGLKSG